MPIESFNYLNFNIMFVMYLWTFLILLLFYLQNFFGETIKDKGFTIEMAVGFPALATPITWFENKPLAIVYFLLLVLAIGYIMWEHMKVLKNMKKKSC